jgi:hypothetical protein
MNKDQPHSGRRLNRILFQIRIVWAIVTLVCFSQFVMATLDAVEWTKFGYPPNNNWLWLGFGILMTLFSVFIYYSAKAIILRRAVGLDGDRHIPLG